MRVSISRDALLCVRVAKTNQLNISTLSADVQKHVPTG